MIKRIIWKLIEPFGYTPKKHHIKKCLARRSEITKNYLDSTQIRKLQIGAQGSPISGWINADIEPRTKETIYMDATETFPFNTNTFHYIFSEHMIEHISFDNASFMLKECFRTLKQNGVIRISTPDLEKTLHRLKTSSTPDQEYINHYVKTFYGDNYPNLAALQINKLFYGFHHRFIHDFKSLEYLLTQAGFSEIRKVEVGTSEYQELLNVEHHGTQIGDTFNRLESIVIEAIKR